MFSWSEVDEISGSWWRKISSWNKMIEIEIPRSSPWWNKSSELKSPTWRTGHQISLQTEARNMNINMSNMMI